MIAFARSLALSFVLLLPAAAAPVITEFCASNKSLLADEDGDHSDWVEIHNPDSTAADLTGWYLTDKADAKTKWSFPAMTLAPNAYLVVFASGKDRRVPGAPLHTNFSLAAGGEYLGLIEPDGVTVAGEFAPVFPAQFSDVSYGIPSSFEETELIAEDAACVWKVPVSSGDPSVLWRETGYPASGWSAATMGIGYGTKTTFHPYIGPGGDIRSALNGNSSCYVRIPFTVAGSSSLGSLKLRVRYDDGFAVWLNGTPLNAGGSQLKRNAPSNLKWNSTATRNHDDPEAVVYEDFDVSENLGLLVNGNNVLAFHALNSSSRSSDMLLQIKLLADAAIDGPPQPPGYFGVATPGAANPGPAGFVIPQNVTFSANSRTFITPFSLALGGAGAGQEILFTTDGSVPTAANGTLFSASLPIWGTKVVRARIYDPATGALGFVSAGHYELLSAALANYNSTGQPFRSSLPIIVLNNNGGGEPANDNVYRDTRVQIFDRDSSGYASLGAAPALTLNTGVKLRGRSSAGFPKKSYGIEVRDETGQGRNESILGMPAGEDWALVGCYNFDRAFSRNAWIYEISRQAGRWAPRTRLVEVWFNQDGGDLGNSDYRGVYILCETIRQSAQRVDIAKLEPANTAPPAVSGGYIFKVDAAEPDEFSWRTNRNLPPLDSLAIHRPKLASLAPEQPAWLKDYFQQFEDAVFTERDAGFTTRNYRNFIDSAAWADHNIFNALAKNVDALRLSAYFTKDRGEKIAAGPLWDFDRSVDSTDGRDDSPITWNGTGDATQFFDYAWWQPLFQDVEFRQTFVDRWSVLRRGSLATANVNAVLDGYLAEFKSGDSDNPARRDYAKWYGSPTSNNIGSEITLMKSWLQTRSQWIDGQFAAAPVISRPSGPASAGDTVTISAAPGNTIYYTTDGSDPRAEGGGASPGATFHTGPVTISATLQLTARAFRTGAFPLPATNWSAPASALFLVDETYASAATVRVSAINYHPLEPSAAESAALPGVSDEDFEWFELQNISAAPVNLEGVSLPVGKPVSAITFPAFSLAPGERAVVAKNSPAFALRYGPAAARIVATWPGYRALDNGGGTILVLDRDGATIADVAYEEDKNWPTRADGRGSALEYIGATGSPEDYADPASWKSSTAVHGSPGLGGPVRSGVVINEILARGQTTPSAVELFNSTATTVDLGGWFLTDSTDSATEDDFRQFRIPEGTQIPAGGFVTFPETALGFTLDGARGGALCLVSGDPATGELRAFEQTEIYGPTLPDAPIGRTPDGQGDLVPIAVFTPAAANAAPRIGPIQVDEIHYHPAAATPEFVEIANTGTTDEPLAGWTLRGDVDFDFPAGFEIAAAEAIVLVGFDPAASPALATDFRAQYSVASEVRLVGPWLDSLGDAAGTVRLRRRVPPPSDEPDFVGLMIEDDVPYSATAPWPDGASGTGLAIRRLGIHRQAADPTAWIAAAPTPGSGVGGWFAWQLATDAGPATADPDNDGLPNLAEYLLGTDPNTFSKLQISESALEYTVRLDRDDAALTAEQSDNLEIWIPAANDILISTDGVTATRRAEFPSGERGFLRLRATKK